jgi:hypothetical protein
MRNLTNHVARMRADHAAAQDFSVDPANVAAENVPPKVKPRLSCPSGLQPPINTNTKWRDRRSFACRFYADVSQNISQKSRLTTTFCDYFCSAVHYGNPSLQSRVGGCALALGRPL